MKLNNALSIVIPTYNRSDFLDYSLSIHIPILREFNIAIYISDNASSDDTERVVKKWMTKYEFLYYCKNETNIGADANFEKALKIPNTDYVWLLSDTYQIPIKSIKHIIELLNINIYDALILNLTNKLSLKSLNYIDENIILSDLGALMTCAAVNIYNKDLIKFADFNRYNNTNFIQTGIVFEYISNKKFKISWIQEHSVTMLKSPQLKKTNWSNTPKAFEIGCEDWTNFVMSLPPSYKLENKVKCIMDFGKVSGLFNFKKLLYLRSDNLLNYVIYKKFKFYFTYTIDYPNWMIFLISISPKIFFKILIKLYNKFKGR